MKYLKLTILISIIFFSSCKAQNLSTKNLSSNSELNYIIANISNAEVYKKALFKEGMYIKIYQMLDSRATPERYFDGTDEVLQSLIISSQPDGDYYTKSELYKIEGLLNPKVIGVEEKDFPNFIVRIEHGEPKKRKTQSFVFEGAK